MSRNCFEIIKICKLVWLFVLPKNSTVSLKIPQFLQYFPNKEFLRLSRAFIFSGLGGYKVVLELAIDGAIFIL